jgi:hypothetical protein
MLRPARVTTESSWLGDQTDGSEPHYITRSIMVREKLSGEQR